MQGKRIDKREVTYSHCEASLKRLVDLEVLFGSVMDDMRIEKICYENFVKMRVEVLKVPANATWHLRRTIVI